MYGAYICDRVAIGDHARVAGFICDGTRIGDRSTVMGNSCMNTAILIVGGGRRMNRRP